MSLDEFLLMKPRDGFYEQQDKMDLKIMVQYLDFSY